MMLLISWGRTFAGAGDKRTREENTGQICETEGKIDVGTDDRDEETDPTENRGTL